ncbi:MAG TPA: TraB/GumN family protein [Saprospiraceae bacterium]|nr:TraB/GumN family protein [Saprospiraceae bacterium]
MKVEKSSKKQTLLWKIIDDDSKIVSYVYGTIHLRDKRVYFLLDKIKDLIKESDVFIAEYNLDDADSSDVISMLQLPDGKQLKDLIPEKKYNKLNKQLIKSFGLDLDRVGYFKPMVIENMVTEMMFMNDYAYPMDVILWNFAKENGLSLMGAEATDGQIEIMRKLSLDQQIKSLIEIGKNPSKYRKKIKKLVSYYENQNLKELHKGSLKTLGKLKKILVYDRNIRIAKTISQHARKNKVFAAIGAGHLSGEKGILRLLKQQGFKVKPMKIPATGEKN